MRNEFITIGSMSNSYEKVKTFRYSGSWLAIKFRIKAGNWYYYSVQTHLSSRFLSKNFKIKLYKNNNFANCCEKWSLALRKEWRLKVFEDRMPRRIFGPKRDEIGEWRRLHNEELHSFYRSPNIVGVIKSRRLRWGGHVEVLSKF